MKRLLLSSIFLFTIVFLALTVNNVLATPMSGDQFIITGTVTNPDYIEYFDNNPSQTISVANPNYGQTYTIDITLGAPDAANPGFFSFPAPVSAPYLNWVIVVFC